MQIVIEIDDDDYQFIKDTEFENYVVTQHLYEAVYEGKSLPNKEELINALNYDRNQYSKGYKDGVNDVLDKIKAEFISLYPKNYAGEPELGGLSCVFSLNKVFEILDKYKEESEVEK